MATTDRAKITIFHCINSFRQPSGPLDDRCEIKYIKMPCSSMTKDVYLLRAFEAGADAVLVLVCFEGSCRYADGNIRAKKRVKWVQDLLDEIGMNGKKQLAVYNAVAGDDKAAREIIDSTLNNLKEINK